MILEVELSIALVVEVALTVINCYFIFFRAKYLGIVQTGERRSDIEGDTLPGVGK